MTPGDIEKAIYTLDQELADTVERLPTLLDAAGRTEVRYKVAYAKAALMGAGAVEVRKWSATVATEDELSAWKAAEAVAEAAKEACRVGRDRLSGLQTLLNATRHQVGER